jgi:hypothetical protein
MKTLKIIFLALLFLGNSPLMLHAMQTGENQKSFLRTFAGGFALGCLGPGILSLYNQIHNENYSFKRSLFTTGCLMMGIVGLAEYSNFFGGKWTFKPWKILSKNGGRYVEETEIIDDCVTSRVVRFVTEDGEAIWREDESGSDLHNNYEDDEIRAPRRPQLPTPPRLPRRPIRSIRVPYYTIDPLQPLQPLPPLRPLDPFVDPFDFTPNERTSSRRSGHRTTTPGQFYISCTLF